MAKPYDRNMEQPRCKDALRGAPVVIRLLVCLAAFFVPLTAAAVLGEVLPFWGSDLLYLSAATVAFVLLLVGPVAHLGAIDLGDPRPRGRRNPPL